MATGTQRASVVLDVRTSRDPSPLIHALRAADVHVVSRSPQRSEGMWFVTFERSLVGLTLEATAGALLDGIEALTGEAREIWYVSALRELHLGFEIGTAPRVFSEGLTSEILSRAAAAGMSMRITIERPAPSGG